MAVRTVEEIMASVKERIGEDTSDEALSFIEDIQDTALCSVYTNLFEKTGDLNVIFSQLPDIEYPENGKIYLLRTSEGVKIFAEYDDFDAYFVKEFLMDCTPWETLNDDELEEWIERVRSEFKGIPCLEYEE